MARGSIHDVFFTNINQLATSSEAIGTATKNGGARQWQVPEKVADVLDIPGTTAAFDRTEIDTNYVEVIGDGENPGAVGDVVSLKTQGDYVGVMERGFRARHCTPVRCLAMAAARRVGHGDPRGVLMGGVVKYAQDSLTAANA